GYNFGCFNSLAIEHKELSAVSGHFHKRDKRRLAQSEKKEFSDWKRKESSYKQQCDNVLMYGSVNAAQQYPKEANIFYDQKLYFSVDRRTGTGLHKRIPTRTTQQDVHSTN
ncbi:hypothetical protein TNIN_175461, partial [Trichonephila inaurata madagascariensis]